MAPARIVTYRSENADPGKEWLALIETATGTMMVHATGPTEPAVIAKMTAFAEDQEVKGNKLAAPKRGRKAA